MDIGRPQRIINVEPLAMPEHPAKEKQIEHASVSDNEPSKSAAQLVTPATTPRGVQHPN